MSLTKHIRDMWCKFQGELFPQIEAEVGPSFIAISDRT